MHNVTLTKTREEIRIMAKKQDVWNVAVNGLPYKIQLAKNKISINDGEEVKLKKFRHKSNFPNMEYYIPVADKELVLYVGQSFGTVLTMDGRDCLSGEVFEAPVMPKWAWIFIVLYIIDFTLLIGGAIGGAINAAMAYFTIDVASNTKKSLGKRVAICIGSWLVATIGEFILAVFVLSIM